MVQYSSYCAAIAARKFNVRHKDYHDNFYGFAEKEDNALFGRLLMEINQAGLSWDTVLNKSENIKATYANFDIEQVANFTETDIERLLQNPGIIRMRKKIEAAIYNAQQILLLQQEHGSFNRWIDLQHPQKEENWIKCFKTKFKFTGKEITKEFLMGIGYLKGAHVPECPLYDKVLKSQPKWLEV